jgi:hypothetical protein
VSFLHAAVEKMKGKKCEKLVKRTGNEVSLSAGIEAGGFKINVANFSNVIKELVQIPDTAVTLDDTQYLLCTAISDMKEMPQLKEKCIAVRLQLIIGFNQLRAILASIKEEPTEELKKELAKWLRYMNDLHKHSISVLNPESDIKDKAGSTLEQIRQYQGIDDQELQQAVNTILLDFAHKANERHPHTRKRAPSDMSHEELKDWLHSGHVDVLRMSGRKGAE